MTTVSLRLDGSAPPSLASPGAWLPRRFRISRGAVEQVAELVDCSLPWDRLPEPSRTFGALDAPLAPPPGPDPEAELRTLRLLTDDGLHPEVVAALAVFGAPEVLVDLDVSVRRAAAPSGIAQVRSWQRLRAGRVTTLATAGSPLLELGWFDDDLWQVELARAVTVRTPATGAAPPARLVELPHELLLGTGEALRLHRGDVFAELVRRHVDTVRVDGAQRPPGEAAAHEQLRLLHTSALGRMQAVVAGVGRRGSRKAGWVSWLLFPDGWRALPPYTSGGVAMVRVEPVEPLCLGVEVARLATGVRA